MPKQDVKAFVYNVRAKDEHAIIKFTLSKTVLDRFLHFVKNALSI